MSKSNYSHTRTFQTFATVSTICLFLATMSGALIGLSPRMRLLPSYIFFFSFAAFSVMMFQTTLARSPRRLPQLDLSQQQSSLVAALVVSGLAVFSELTLIPWPKIIAGIILGIAVIVHGYHIWKGFTLEQIWKHIPLRFFATDMVFLLVAAVGLFALGWKETWPDFPLIPEFLRPSTVFLGASFPLTLTFTGYLHCYADANGGLSKRESRIFDWWYYLLVGGVLSFLFVILLDWRGLMLTMALILATGVFIVNLLFARRLAQNPKSLGFLFAFIGLAGLLATSTGGVSLIISNTPTIPAGQNPILLSHVHMAQLMWVCISFWGILYTLWPMMLELDKGHIRWLPLGDDYPPAARNLVYLQLGLALSGLVLLIISHLTDSHPIMVISGLVYAAATLAPIPIMRAIKVGAHNKG